MFIDYSAREDCMNEDSFGEICVRCNMCGRFNPDTAKQAQIRHYKEQLKDYIEFDRWEEGWEERQREVVAESIKYYKDKLKALGVEV